MVLRPSQSPLISYDAVENPMHDNNSVAFFVFVRVANAGGILHSAICFHDAERYCVLFEAFVHHLHNNPKPEFFVDCGRQANGTREMREEHWWKAKKGSSTRAREKKKAANTPTYP